MNYDALKAPLPTLEIDLGQNRKAPAKMLKAAEQMAIYQAMPEPEAPVVGKSPLGEPIRDDGDSQYIQQSSFWQLKQAALTVAVSIGYEPSGVKWDSTHLIEPSKSDKTALARFMDAQRQRKQYAQKVVDEFIGDGRVEALFSRDEIIHAMQQVQMIGMGELIGKSAEGNSLSGEGGGQDPQTPG